MQNKIVVITGAGSGLGASLAKKYSSSGYYVCLLGRSSKKLEKVANQCTDKTSIYEVDVSLNKLVRQTIKNIETDLGPIDTFINNAGIGIFDLSENIDEQSVHQMLDINTKGTIFCTQAVLPYMKERNHGNIINIVSTAGKQGKVNESVYCASKFAVRGFTESLILEIKDTPIRAFGVYMGGMKTEFWDGIFTEEQTKSLMDPKDVAEIIYENAKQRSFLTVEEVVIRNKK